MKKEPKKSKKKVADLVARFRAGLASGRITIEEAMWIAEQLQGLTDQALPYLTKMLTSPEEDAREAAITLLRELGDRRAVGPLRRMLDNPDYSDEEKMEVIHVLQHLGAPVDEATFRRAISDPDTLMKETLHRMLETIHDPVQVEALLDAMEQQMPPEAQEQYVRDLLGQLTDRRLLLMLSALLHSEHDAVVLAAIDAIERLKEPATIPLLEERARHDPSNQVRHAADNAALRLQMRTGDRPSQPWITPSALPLSRCLLSTIDGNGGQVLFIARERSDGDLQGVDILFNDHEGIKDCFSLIVDEGELDVMLDSFGMSVDFVDVCLARARSAVSHAYQATLAASRRLPPAFMVWQGWLEGEDQRSVEEFPLPSLASSQQAEWLVKSAELLTLDEFGYWFFNPDEVESHVPHYRRLLQKGQAERGEAAFETLLDEVIEAVVDEEYRRLLAGRLRRQAWLLAQLYEEEEIPLWALAAAAAFDQGVLVEHPLLRDMMEESLRNAAGIW